MDKHKLGHISNGLGKLPKLYRTINKGLQKINSMEKEKWKDCKRLKRISVTHVNVICGHWVMSQTNPDNIKKIRKLALWIIS